MKNLAVILAFVFLFTASNLAQNELPKIKAEKSYKQTGVKFVSPNQADWQIVKSENFETSFIKPHSNGEYSAFVRTKSTDAFENVEDFFVHLEKLKQEEIQNLSLDSLHFNRTNFKETKCLQYDGIFPNGNGENASSYKYLNMYGYICQHPTSKVTLIQFEFSGYSNVRGFSDSENKLFREFFENIQYVKVKNKK